MNDITDNPILCKACNEITKKSTTLRDGFIIRTWTCPNCNKTWYHPADIQEYNSFLKLKNKTFKVKLRMVGNSFCVSIPREIIAFKELEKEMNKLVYLSLEEPEKLSLSFAKIKQIMEDI